MHQPVPGQYFREFLRDQLRKKTNQNPNYSLRAFARTLKISPSGLSMMMGGKTPVTLKSIEKICTHLKLAGIDTRQHMLNLVNEKSQPPEALKEYEVIDFDKVELIKEWYHYGILNLMRTKDFKPQSKWIARRLGITLGEVQSAVERLQKVGLLRVKDGKWIDISNKFTTHTNNKKFNEAARLYQLQIFQKATTAIEECSFEKRNHTGIAMAIAMKDLDKAKEHIAKFRKDFLKIFDKTSDADEVYHLSVALFPLSKTDLNKK